MKRTAMHKAVVDVHYKADGAKAVCLLFKDWEDESPVAVIGETVSAVEDYQPGAFYKRELPCLLQVLKKVELQNVEAVVVDGYVFLDDGGTPGLGARLYEAVDRRVTVIGVAKTKYRPNTNSAVEVKRGDSLRPLYVSAVGMEVQEAMHCIHRMAGEHRIPTLLKLLDRCTRQL